MRCAPPPPAPARGCAIGFNHRYHRAFRKAREIFDSGALGEMMFVRGRYGHGGRPGYDKEWRAVPELSGGGELIDQGMHLIDLARWFLGDFEKVQGHIATYFWNMPVEDNGFLLLRTAARPDGIPARQLDRMEEPVLLRDLRPRRQARNHGPRRKLRHRASDVLSDVRGHGTARNHHLGISDGRRLLGSRVRRVSGRYPAGPPAGRRASPTRRLRLRVIEQSLSRSPAH